MTCSCRIGIFVGCLCGRLLFFLLAILLLRTVRNANYFLCLRIFTYSRAAGPGMGLLLRASLRGPRTQSLPGLVRMVEGGGIDPEEGSLRDIVGILQMGEGGSRPVDAGADRLVDSLRNGASSLSLVCHSPGEEDVDRMKGVAEARDAVVVGSRSRSILLEVEVDTQPVGGQSLAGSLVPQAEQELVEVSGRDGDTAGHRTLGRILDALDKCKWTFVKESRVRNGVW